MTSPLRIVRRLPLALLFTAVLSIASWSTARASRAAPDGAGVELSPTRITFHPDTAATEVEVRNTGSSPIRIGNFQIVSGDWASFSIVEGLDPRRLAPGASLRFHVAVDPESLLDDRGSYRRGEANLTFVSDGATRELPLVFEDPSWLWSTFIPALIKIHALALGFVLPLAALLTWLERKQSAMMQDRVGPNMARIKIGPVTLRLWGLLHIATDGIKMLFKEDFVPRHAHRPLYTLAPLMALAPAMIVFAIVPFGDAVCYGRLLDVVTQADVDQCAAGLGGTPLQVARIDVGLLFYFAIASLATYGTTLAGWASYNKWAVLGALRASAQMISYEVALGLTLVGALLVYGSLEPHALVHAQLESYWGIVLQPIAFVLFFTAAIAETKRAPFDLPEGESEIIGYFIEYSGMRFGLFFLSEFMEVVFVGAIVTTLFLGGWALPLGIMGAHGFTTATAALGFFTISGLTVAILGMLLTASNRAVVGFGRWLVVLGVALVGIGVWSVAAGWATAVPHVAVIAIGLLTWGLKVVVLCWLQLLIRWTLPRFRYDQLMSLGWKGLLPLSIANIVLTALVVFALTKTTGPIPDPPAAGAAREEASP